MLLLMGVRSCGGHCGFGSRFGAFFQFAVLFFSSFELNSILIDVLGRTHFRSQVEFCGLC